jgi:hypothetical protein
MACSLCGQSGHKRQSCPNGSQPRDRAIILRLDNMTETEQTKMAHGVQKLKKKVTSDEARATMVTGKSKELPMQVRAALGFRGKTEEN